MDIDPRLRGSTDSIQTPYDPNKRNASYAETTQSSSYEPLQPAGTPTSNTQQHQYYGVQTPTTYNSGVPGGSAAESPYAQNSGGESNQGDPASDLKRPRACEACRQLKVRCEPDEANQTGACKRCVKANRQCVITVPSRKRQKKTDSRVAELEKKIDALTASLQAQQGPPTNDPSIDPSLAQAHVGELQQNRQTLYTQSPQPAGQWITPKPTQGSEASTTPTPQTHAGVKRKMPDPPTFSFIQPSSHVNPSPTSAPNAGARNENMNTATTSQGWLVGGRDLNDNYVDVIDRHLLDMETARRMFQRYMIDMTPSLPAVVFHPGTSADEIRKAKPVLFLAILSVASGAIRPDIQLKLVAEVSRIYADRIVCRGEKTLELVQSMVVTSTWYQPPDRYEELNFNQLIHIAAVMAVDMGMGKRTRNAGKGLWKEYMDKGRPMIDSNALDVRRTWLGCYFLCANAAMSLRRQVLVRWGPYMDESIEMLESSPEAFPTDKWLCHLVRAQHIAEDVGFEFSMDDTTAIVSLADSKTQYHLKAFERHMNDWRQRGKSIVDLQNPSIRFADAIIDLYTHEIVIHHEHNIDDFKPPYINQAKPVDESESSPEPDFLTPNHVDALTICLQSAHKALDAFLDLGVEGIRVAPTLIFVRTSYAVVVLIKLHSAITGSGGGRFGAVFKKEDLKVEYYMDRLIRIHMQATEGNQCRTAGKFAFVLTMLKNWHVKRKEGRSHREGYGHGTDQQALLNREAERSKQHTPLRQQQQQAKRAPQRQGSTPQGSSGSSHLSNPGSVDSGLHMLSEAASTSNPRGPPPQTHNLFQNNSQFAPMAAMGLPGTATGAGMVDPGYMSMAALAPDLDSLNFGQEDINMLGSLIDEPTFFHLETMGMTGYDTMGAASGYANLSTSGGGAGAPGGWTG